MSRIQNAGSLTSDVILKNSLVQAPHGTWGETEAQGRVAMPPEQEDQNSASCQPT